MPWHRAAGLLCRRHGFPPHWIELFEQGADVPADPRAASGEFERWALTRLTTIWAGRHQEEGLDGTLAAYLVQRYLSDSARVLRYRYRLSDEEWEDLVADAGERSLRVFSEREIEAPRPYLFRTLRRAIWEYLRKARLEVASLDLPAALERGPDPEEKARWAELLRTFMEQCYSQLRPEERRLFEALVVDGRSAADVGEAFGLAPNAVNVRKFRVRAWLKECLRSRSGDEDPFG